VKMFPEGKAMAIETAIEDGVRVISIRGEVDLSTSPELRKVLLQAVEAAEGKVTVDLRAVRYMDSSGVATLIEGLQASRRRKARFTLLAPSKQVRNVLALTRLDAVFEIREAPAPPPAAGPAPGSRG
jgi:anti-sigma B factor antagonist